MQIRGKIYNTGKAAIFNDFSGLRYNNCTPTDIDGLMELGDRHFMLFEVKHRSAEMPRGQQLALERVIDALSKVRHAILIMFDHDVTPEQKIDIDVANCIVRKYRTNSQWHNGNGKTVVEVTNEFVGRKAESQRCDDKSQHNVIADNWGPALNSSGQPCFMNFDTGETW